MKRFLNAFPLVGGDSEISGNFDRVGGVDWSSSSIDKKRSENSGDFDLNELVDWSSLPINNKGVFP